MVGSRQNPYTEDFVDFEKGMVIIIKDREIAKDGKNESYAEFVVSEFIS